jgi:hypothetical protein
MCLERSTEPDARGEVEPLVGETLRRLPEPRQRLVARHLAGRERDERLEDGRQPVRVLDDRDNLAAVAAVRVLERDLVGIEAARRAGLALCQPQRALRRLCERVGIAAVAREQRVPRREREREAVELELGRRFARASDDHLDLIDRRLGEDQRELIANHPAEHVRCAQAGAEPLRKVAQQRVTGLLAVRVVDPLQAVEVHEHQRHRRHLALRALDLNLERAANTRTTRHARERVGTGGAVEFGGTGSQLVERGRCCLNLAGAGKRCARIVRAGLHLSERRGQLPERTRRARAHDRGQQHAQQQRAGKPDDYAGDQAARDRVR